MMIKLVLDTFIPGDTSLGMPSAALIDFETYQCKYKIQQLVSDFLAELALLSLDKFGKRFVDLNEDSRLAAVNACKSKNVRLFADFLTNCFRAYYSDQAVLNRLPTGSVPPFPIGNVLEQDDWRLLEPVYDRGPIYRTVPEI